MYKMFQRYITCMGRQKKVDIQKQFYVNVAVLKKNCTVNTQTVVFLSLGHSCTCE